ncbi:uncharacterized protein FIESC28_00653 [Fusarium coffeatum]|uniref:Uncharacterized protein n=1 Tax=Fusarium coffeatum TaxID=231269 RepID=A0A366SCZ5_9HYPO|nr:uncharacterized protein FIESC28_00653 [Fusarium coffeatum]RBR26536.1 hypothetical protein FIESC28_00653 [Fusarium coffeatum]
MSLERFEFDRRSIGAWIKYELDDPRGYGSECFMKLDQNIFPFYDFTVEEPTGTPIFKPRQGCLIRVTPLSAAAYLGDEDAVRRLSQFPDPHEANELISPLALAYLQGHSRAIELLAERDETRNTLNTAHIAARTGQSHYIRYLYRKFHSLQGACDVHSIPPAVHALYLHNDEQIKEVLSALIYLDEDALDTVGIWQHHWTCADLARAMGKSGDLVDWLEDKCRSITS